MSEPIVVPHTKMECPHCHDKIDTTYSTFRGSWRIRVHHISVPTGFGGEMGVECDGSRLIIEEYYSGYGVPDVLPR